MKLLKCVFGLFLSVLVITTQSYSQSFNQEEYLVGTWLGKLKFQTTELRLVIRVEMKDGKLSALLDSPDQGTKDIPISEIKLKADSVFVTSTLIGGKFDGLFFKDSLKIAGIWKQGGGSFPLELRKVDKVEGPKRPQEPKPPFGYNTEDIEFDNVKAGIKLAGTFTYPKEGSDFPAVVMISGSGGQDRDELAFNHKPFLVIADHLTKNGIAVLRFDDRGIGKSKGVFAGATTKDFAEDVLAAVEYLKTRKEIDKKKIGLIGHSEGGIIAPMIASENQDISFIVLLAGPGIAGDELILKQAQLIMETEGQKQEAINNSMNTNRKLYELAKSDADTSVINTKTKEYIHEFYLTLSEEDKKTMPPEERFAQRQQKIISSPWFRYFLKYDPRPALEKVKCPVLALNGEKDIQVPPKENLSAIEEALKKGGNKKYKVIEFPGLNHIFQPCTTCSISEYAKIEETFSPMVLGIMTDWIIEIIK
ncbi:MAG: alpha/beta hydrolase [Ignavibacteriales bacterium]|nr:MAG: alpha/beta hydrolase [Ignavibacteriales bacterium]